MHALAMFYYTGGGGPSFNKAYVLGCVEILVLTNSLFL